MGGRGVPLGAAERWAPTMEETRESYMQSDAIGGRGLVGWPPTVRPPCARPLCPTRMWTVRRA